ncbi:MAG: cupin domain-containing protein [Candidatus Bathyarchaeia archaeon]
MSKLEVKSTNNPDETRTFEKGKLELVKTGGATIGRAILQPGWRWSTHVKPIVKTKSCEAPHLQYHVSGTLHVLMDDGTEKDCKPGDVSLVPSGHDAWVVGNEPVVIVDFQGMVDYAKQSTKK